MGGMSRGPEIFLILMLVFECICVLACCYLLWTVDRRHVSILALKDMRAVCCILPEGSSSSLEQRDKGEGGGKKEKGGGRGKEQTRAHVH